MAPATGFDVGALRVGSRIYTNLSLPRALVGQELEQETSRAGRWLASRDYATIRLIAHAQEGAPLDVVGDLLAVPPAAVRLSAERLGHAGLAAEDPAHPGRWAVTGAGRQLVTDVPGPRDTGPFAQALATLTADDVELLARQLLTLADGLRRPPAGMPDAAEARSANFVLWLAFLRLWRLVRGEQTRFLSARTDGELDAATYQALYRIHAAACTVADVGGFLHVDEPSALRYVDRLVGRRLVERDARTSLVPTARGVRILEAVPPLDPAGRFNTLVRGLPNGGRDLDDVLERLVHGFGTVPAINFAGFDELLARIRAHHEQGDVGGVDREAFRTTMAQFPTGVAVVTVASGRTPRGITVNSLTSVSLDPPMLLVCFDRRSAALEHLVHSRAFAANVLTVDQRDLAVRFGRRESPGNSHMLDDDQWSDVDGVPTLVGSLASIVCDIEDTFEAGTHTIVLAAPRHVRAHPASASVDALGFWRSRYFPVQSSTASER